MIDVSRIGELIETMSAMAQEHGVRVFVTAVHSRNGSVSLAISPVDLYVDKTGPSCDEDAAVEEVETHDMRTKPPVERG